MRYACPVSGPTWRFDLTRLHCAAKLYGPHAKLVEPSHIRLTAKTRVGEARVDDAAGITADIELIVRVPRGALEAARDDYEARQRDAAGRGSGGDRSGTATGSGSDAGSGGGSSAGADAGAASARGGDGDGDAANPSAGADGGGVPGGGDDDAAGRGGTTIDLGDVTIERLPDSYRSALRNTNMILVGASGVGKSALLLRAAKDVFATTYVSTIGADFKYMKLKVGDVALKLLIWDSSGQARFNNVTESYVKSVAGVLVVFDVTDQHSFESAQEWMATVARINPAVAKAGSMALVGNKVDFGAPLGAPSVAVAGGAVGGTLADAAVVEAGLVASTDSGAGGAAVASGAATVAVTIAGRATKRVVSEEAAQVAATEWGVPFFPTSAKTGEGVDKPFHFLAMKMSSMLPPETGRRLRRNVEESVRRRGTEGKCVVL